MKEDSRFLPYSRISFQWVLREMHLHTNATDGKANIPQVIRRAEELGLAEIVFSEHVRADSEWFPRFAEEVRKEAATSSVRILVGAEARIADFRGSLDISPVIRRECDIIIASVHRFPDQKGNRREFSEVSHTEFAETEYRLALGFLRHGKADVLGHPGGMSVRRLGVFPDRYYLSLLAEARRNGKVVEINCSYMNDLGKYLSFLKETDPLVSIASDAHTLDQIGECARLLQGKLWSS
jgi:putative hydrolase